MAIDARLVAGTSTGDSTYWTGLILGLSKLKLPFTILLCSDKPKPEGVPEGEGIEWVQIPGRNSRWWSIVRYPLAARRLGAKAFHTQYSMSPLVGDRGITTIHDVSFYIGPSWFSAQDRMVLQKTVPRAIKRAAKVITVSETSKKEIEQYVPSAKGKTLVTPLACPPWIHQMPREQAQQVMRQKFGETGPYLLTLSTQWPRKNMQLAIDSVERLSAELPHKLLLTGKPGWGSITPGKRTKALGYVEQHLLSAIYSAADLYICPSRHEGFGLPVLEAFHSGCPVIASTGGSLPEVVANGGVLEPSWDSVAWAATIEELLRNPSKLQELRQRGYEVDRLYSWESTARRTVSAYSEVIN